jgi:hypothetical protein
MRGTRIENEVEICATNLANKTKCMYTNAKTGAPVVVYVPRCVQNGSESLGLKALEDFNVGIGDYPHSRLPSVHVGLSTALYRGSLLSIDSVDLLPSSQ